MKDTRQRILDAALAVFGRDGISGATTREIARVAKVNEVTLFRYFKNKNELLRQTILCSASRYEQVFAEALAGIRRRGAPHGAVLRPGLCEQAAGKTRTWSAPSWAS